MRVLATLRCVRDHQRRLALTVRYVFLARYVVYVVTSARALRHARPPPPVFYCTQSLPAHLRTSQSSTRLR